jgi:hypothetical protein
MLRSIAAVAAGFVVIFLLATGTDLGIKSAFPAMFGPGGRVDSVPLLLATNLYVFVFATFGCWLTARLAPARPMLHAMILGGLGLAFNILGSAMMWDSAPVWYHALAVAMALPAAWLGGWIRERQLARAGGEARLATA